MRMYIANVTNQYQDVRWRDVFNTPGHILPFRAPKSLMIPPGKQVPLGGDGDIKLFEEIIRQLTPYGLVGVVDVPKLKPRQKVRLVFNLDRPVSKSIMDAAKNHNMGFLMEDGKRRRMAASIAANEALIRQVNALNDMNDINTPVDHPRATDSEFEQMESLEDTRNIAEGVKVVNDGSEVDPAPRRVGRPRRSSAG